MCVPQESEDAVKVLAKEKDMLEREKWDLRRQTKEATEQANILRAQMDMKENRVKELEAELTMVSHTQNTGVTLASLSGMYCMCGECAYRRGTGGKLPYVILSAIP